MNTSIDHRNASCIHARRTTSRAAAAVAAAMLALAAPALANTFRWDTDGQTAGATSDPSGVASGTWSASIANWSPGDGNVATIGWDNDGGHVAIFSASNDATGASTITLDGTINVWAMGVEEGNVTLTGGQINFLRPYNTIDGTASLTINSVVGGTSVLAKGPGAGALVLNNTANTYSGGTMISGGTVTFAGAGALGTGTVFFGGNTGANTNPIINSAATLRWADGNTYDVTSQTLVINTSGLSTLDIGSNNVTFASSIQNASNGGVTKSGSGTLTMNAANKYLGDTRIAAGSLVLGNASALQYSSLDLNAADVGTVSFGSLTAVTLGGIKGARPLDLTNASLAPITLTVGNNDASAAYSGNLSGAGSLVKVGVGAQTLSGNNTFTGPTTIQNGTLTLDYTTNNTDKLSPAALVTLGTGGGSVLGGALGTPTLRVTGSASAATSQTIGGLNLAAGGSSNVAVVAGSGQTATLNLGAITRGAASAVDFTLAAGSGATITTTTPTLGSWATVNRTDWARIDSGNVVPLTTYAVNDFSSPANDVDVTTSQSAPANMAVNTLRFNTPDEDVQLSLSGDNSVSGILVTPAVGAWFPRITGGTLTSPTGELILQQHNPYVGIGSPVLFPDLSIDSKITGGTTLVKAGAGLVALEADNDYTGGTIIAGGILQIGNGGSSGSLPAGTVTTSGVLGIYRTDGQYTFTNDITGSGGVDIGNEFTRANNNMGRITLAGSNTYTGSTRVWKGTLVVDDPSRVGPGPLEPKGNGGLGTIEVSGGITLPNTIRFNGRGTETVPDYTPLFTSIGDNTLSGEISMATGGAFYNLESQSGTLTVTGNFYSPTGNRYLTLLGAGNGVYAGRITNGAGRAFLRKLGSGTWTLTSPNNTFSGDVLIQEGTLKIGAENALGQQGTANIASGATLDLNGFDTILGNLTGNGSVLLPAGSTLTTTKAFGGGPGTVFNGQLIGSGTLVKEGGHYLQLSADQTSFTGSIIVNGATLQVGTGGATGSFPGSIPILINGGAFAVNRSDDFTLTNLLTGRGGFTKEGTNTLQLTGPNTFTGQTTINGGVIRLTGPNQLGTSISAAAGAAATSELRLDNPAGFTTANGVLFGGRNTGNLAPQLHNVSGDNTVTGPISITTGGNGVYVLQVDAGSKLTFAGDLVSAPDQGRTLQFFGAGDGAWTGGIKIGSMAFQGAGTWTFSGGAANTYTGNTTINSGTLRLGANNSVPAASALIVGAAGTFNLSGFTDTVRTLTLSAGGKIDLAGGTLTANYTTTSPAPAIHDAIAAAYNAGGWDGVGVTTGIITSSAAASDPLDYTAVGYLDTGTSVIIDHTWYGDANLNGVIDADDYALLDRGAIMGLTGWVNGDFNYDNAVNTADYFLIDRVFASQGGASPAWLAAREAQFGHDYVEQLLASVPEPASAGLVTTALLTTLLPRRRRGIP